MRIAMPVEEDRGMDSPVCEHFGQTPLWAVYDTEGSALKLVANKSQHGGGGCLAIDEIKQHKPDMLFVLGMGWNAINRCASEGITVRTGPFRTVREVAGNLDRLQDMAQGCTHSDCSP